MEIPDAHSKTTRVALGDSTQTAQIQSAPEASAECRDQSATCRPAPRNSCSWRSTRLRVQTSPTATSARNVRAAHVRAGASGSATGSRHGRDALHHPSESDPRWGDWWKGVKTQHAKLVAAAEAEQAARAQEDTGAVGNAAGKRRAQSDSTPNKGGQRKDAPATRERVGGEGNSAVHALMFPPSQVDSAEAAEVAEAIAVVRAVEIAEAAEAAQERRSSEAAPPRPCEPGGTPELPEKKRTVKGMTDERARQKVAAWPEMHTVAAEYDAVVVNLLRIHQN